jgi:ABC-type uncharacterized transport system fused permease/ATPase subunit
MQHVSFLRVFYHHALCAVTDEATCTMSPRYEETVQKFRDLSIAKITVE